MLYCAMVRAVVYLHQHRLMQLRSTRACNEQSTSVQHTLQLPALSTGNVHYDVIAQVQHT
jgi:hypothetical protein